LTDGGERPGGSVRRASASCAMRSKSPRQGKRRPKASPNLANRPAVRRGAAAPLRRRQRPRAGQLQPRPGIGQRTPLQDINDTWGHQTGPGLIARRRPSSDQPAALTPQVSQPASGRHEGSLIFRPGRPPGRATRLRDDRPRSRPPADEAGATPTSRWARSRFAADTPTSARARRPTALMEAAPDQALLRLQTRRRNRVTGEPQPEYRDVRPDPEAEGRLPSAGATTRAASPLRG